jgi:predicted ATPase
MHQFAELCTSQAGSFARFTNRTGQPLGEWNRLFEQALSVAQKQQAKSWELRAATSIARMWSDQGKRDEARELLAPVYGWFTEGFDTLDLLDRAALLSVEGIEMGCHGHDRIILRMEC